MERLGSCSVFSLAMVREWQMWRRVHALPRNINYTRNATLKFYASGKLPNRKQFISFVCVKSCANNVQLVARWTTVLRRVDVCVCVLSARSVYSPWPMICFDCRQINMRHHDHDQCLHIFRQFYAHH